MTDIDGREVALSDYRGQVLLVVNVAAGSVQLNANSTFYGTLRAPASTVTLNSGSRLEGMLLVDRLVLNGGTVRATP